MKKPNIGILAGMGPRSTAPFIDMVVTEAQEQYGARDDTDFPKMMICSQPAPFYEDRPVDHAALEAATLEGLLDLEKAGVDFAAIACNTVHIYYPQLAAALKIPLLNMLELAVASIPKSAKTVALIASQATAEAGIYQKALNDCGFDVATIDYQEAINHLLAATRTSRDGALFTQLWKNILNGIEADAVLVACLDLSAILPHAKTDLPIIDASQALARETIRQWLSIRR